MNLQAAALRYDIAKDPITPAVDLALGNHQVLMARLEKLAAEEAGVSDERELLLAQIQELQERLEALAA